MSAVIHSSKNNSMMIKGTPAGSASAVRRQRGGGAMMMRRSGSFGTLTRTTSTQQQKWPTSAAGYSHHRPVSNPRRAGSATGSTGDAQCRCTEQLENQYLRNLQQQIYFLELENTYLRNDNKKDVRVKPKVIGEAETMLRKLGDAQREAQRSETLLRGREEDAAREMSLLEHRLARSEEAHSRDKRALSDEVLELRKLLDDIRPELTRKDNQLAQLETDLRNARAELRRVKLDSEELHAQLSTRAKQEKALNSLDDQRRRDVDELVRQIKNLQKELSDERTREQLLATELGDMKRTLRESELQSRKEKALGEKILEDNESLIKENAQLTAQLTEVQLNYTSSSALYQTAAVNGERDRTGSVVSGNGGARDYALSELAEAREKEKELRAELIRLQDSVRIEKQHNGALTAQLAERDQADATTTDARKRLESRVTDLDLLSRSLSNDNQQLRKEKLEFSSQLDSLTAALEAKEVELKSVRERLGKLEEQYGSFVRHYQNESTFTDEKSREFENLADRFKFLSRELRHHHGQNHELVVANSEAASVNGVADTTEPLST